MPESPALHAPILATVFANSYDAHDAASRSVTYTWPEFTAMLSARLADPPRAYKEALPMLVPAVWAGERRLKANVAALTLGVLDIDGIPDAQLDGLVTSLTGVRACIYTTPSDRGRGAPEGRKVRLITALDEPIPGQESKRFRKALAAALGVAFDVKTVDDGRGFYVGRVNDNPTPRVLWVSEGTAPVAMRRVLETLPPEAAVTANTALDLGGEPHPDMPELTSAAVANSADYITDLFELCPGSKNAAVYALGGLLRQWGWGLEDGVNAIRRALENRALEHGDVRDIEAGVSAFARGYGCENQHGYMALVETLGGGEAGALEVTGLAEAVPCLAKVYAALIPDLDASPTAQAIALQERIDADAREAEARKAQAQTAALNDDWCGFTFMGREPPVAFTPLVEGLEFAEGYGIAILGKYGRAKSPTAIELGLALATGTPWAGRPTIGPCDVFYLAAEKAFDLQTKRNRIARGLSADRAASKDPAVRARAEIDPLAMHMISLDAEPLNDPALRLRLTELVRRRRALGRRVVVIIDTYAASVQGLEHNASEFAEPLKALLRDCTGLGACVIPLLHARKGSAASKPAPPTMDDAEGSGAIMGAISGCVGIWCPDEDDKARVQICDVRPVRKGFAPFERRWVDVVNPSDASETDWGLAAEALALGAGERDGVTGKGDGEALAETSAKVVRAAYGYMRALVSDAPGQGGAKITRPLSAVAAIVAPGCKLTATQTKAILAMYRTPSEADSAPVELMPFWGRDDALTLRPVLTGPSAGPIAGGLAAFGVAGAGAPSQAPGAYPFPAPAAPSAPSGYVTDPVGLALSRTRPGRYPLPTWCLEHGVEYPSDITARRNLHTRLRDKGGSVDPGKGEGRPPTLVVTV